MVSIQAKPQQTTAEDVQVGKRLMGYLRPEARVFLIAILAMAVVAASEGIIPKVVNDLLDKGFGGDYAGRLWHVPAILTGVALIRGVAQFASGYLLSLISNRVLLKMRMQMFDRMLHAPALFFHRNTAASLINAVIFEVNQVLSILTNVFITLVRDSLTVLALLIYLFYTNWRLTLIVAVILPVIGYLMSKINRRLRRLNRDHQALTNSAAYVVEEAAGGFKVVKLHGGEAYEMDRFRRMSERLKAYSMRMAVAGGLNQPVTAFLAALALSVIITIAMVQAQGNQTTVGGFTGFVMAMLLLISPLKHLTDINQPLTRGITAAEMIFRLIDEPIERREGGLPLARARGDLVFERIGFRYGEAGKAALSGIDFRVDAGEVVALVGPSGSGKTTLVNLVPRFFDPTEGRILLDGKSIDGYSLQDLRHQIAFVSQDVVLFNDTVAANVAYGVHPREQIDMARVERALAAAYLTDVVKGLPEGLETNIGDNGMKLSGGQRQRLAIARALYKDAPILILDEATSALDSESERQVQAALESLMQGRTTLVIAHRLSTIENADRIVVLEQGRVAEQGTHDELLSADGLYAGLHRIQFAVQ
ncbi:lipid A export permease/ATP-binding protein MsbA [Cupriavidus sp. USMAA2-4]|uniref:Lipid A export permease/ATP-binding protein MsbA n=1 Tax=Cupriavidus malaysiensis TaxID=367825 RepID=A0ABM6F2E0_9BURK|nr:lipid A export permease/ATP-binding protein MsbA [Cupriavidus sp. USMAA2-4]AOY99082.1 lipid A export permease/ATP-binding protein MsbA [Cupriavidus sp. USMAHM13]AOZ05504.1 lipid A export permease/ATP-binding protein MsbA [Cupriavidus malaysiensis]